MDRNARLAQQLMVCSTTPRTTRKHLERLNNGHTEQIYAEAKQCMNQTDVYTAYALLEQLPHKFQNVDAYRQKCDTYDNLCRDGVIQRPGTEAITVRLAEILHERSDDKIIIKYADAFFRHGFNEHGIVDMDLDNVDDAISIAEMTEGHGHMMRKHASKNASGSERLWNKFIEALEKCGPIVNCVRKNHQKITTSAKDMKKSGKAKRTQQEDEDDDDAANQNRDNQPNPEMIMVRWKAAETLAGSLVGNDDNDDDDDDDDDDDSTAGDD